MHVSVHKTGATVNGKAVQLAHALAEMKRGFGGPVILLVHGQHCGHCIEMMHGPTSLWETAKKELHSKAPQTCVLEIEMGALSQVAHHHPHLSTAMRQTVFLPHFFAVEGQKITPWQGQPRTVGNIVQFAPKHPALPVKKPAVKKASAKKPAVKKASAKKPAVKKPAVKKPAVKKAVVAKKPVKRPV
jgi:hypothetical protein